MKRRSRASVSTFVIILFMFLLDTAIAIIDVNNAIREITLTLTSTSPKSFSDRYALTNELPYPVQSVLYAYEVSICNGVVDCADEAQSNLGDVIIIWRTYAFWREGCEQWGLVMPIIFFLGSLGRYLTLGSSEYSIT